MSDQLQTPGEDYIVDPAMLDKMRGDMNFVAIVSIIFGAFVCLGIISAVVGVPLIIAGLRLKDAANGLETYLTSRDRMSFQRAFEMKAKYFNMMKIYYLISIVFVALYFVFVILMLAFGAAGGMGLFNGF